MKTAAVAAATVVVALAGCGGHADRSSAIADEIGASSCTQTQYGLVNRFDNSKTRIYDCLRNGQEICVTEENGIAQDQTAVARIVFKNDLSDNGPSCASG